MPERDAAVLKYGADAHGELAFTRLAAPQEARAPLALVVVHHIHVGRTTSWTRGGLTPPLPFHELDREALIRTRRRNLRYHRRLVLRDLGHWLLRLRQV